MRRIVLGIAGALKLGGSPEGEIHKAQLTHDFPDCCLITGKNYPGDGRSFLGCGVVTEDNRVATAAHVIEGKVDIAISFAGSFGEENARNRIKAEHAYIHKGHSGHHSHNDLAILEFDKELEVVPSPRATDNDFKEANLVTVVGYGAMENRGVYLNFEKNYADDIKMISNEQNLNNGDEASYGFDGHTEFVIGPRPCEADSGGPVYTSSGNDRRLLGVFTRKVSWHLYDRSTISNCQRESICSLIKPFNENDYERKF